MVLHFLVLFSWISILFRSVDFWKCSVQFGRKEQQTRMKNMEGQCHRWVVFCIISLSFSLLLTRVSSSSPPTPHTHHGDTDSTAGRTLRQDQGGNHEIHCSRERSRAAWKIIEEYLMPFVEKEQYQISTKCRLHSDNDLYRDQEQHKLHIDINEWQCEYCKKNFYEEKYLDLHFDNRHSNLLNQSQRKCLADVCGALHCDLITTSGVKKSKCNPAAAARNKHLCESLADSCFPVSEGPAAGRLHEFFLHQFCDAHTCTGSQKPFSRGRRKKMNALYLVVSILIVMLLILFYLYVYLYQRGIRRGTQTLRRISQINRKKKPS